MITTCVVVRVVGWGVVGLVVGWLNWWVCEGRFEK
ncbi:hypothetical protein LCGC14_0788710 [marine sediment metagenome]|uniref:Uncharacterized protein n=1 Tax=marine sediment metagenome TaxID=412755 RepID=A0A0F9PTC2_9ZZZZ